MHRRRISLATEFLQSGIVFGQKRGHTGGIGGSMAHADQIFNSRSKREAGIKLAIESRSCRQGSVVRRVATILPVVTKIVDLNTPFGAAVIRTSPQFGVEIGLEHLRPIKRVAAPI